MRKNAISLVLAGLISGGMLIAQQRQQKDPVDYVSPNIGGIGQLLTATIPYVQSPHGMARLAPITTPGVKDRYLADKIYGFPAGPATLMASVGAIGADPESMRRTLTMILKLRHRITMRPTSKAGESKLSLPRVSRQRSTDSPFLRADMRIWFSTWRVVQRLR